MGNSKNSKRLRLRDGAKKIRALNFRKTNKKRNSRKIIIIIIIKYKKMNIKK